ncbi:hypothetical protein SCHPADRAFT_486558 [Schizopora paradoxa]|uniref:Uncharacterized protein n=1 Tax=Schizopora paradoxa TaxID=27342 RepID=A0A0H2RGW3_9AGAM|nr:hypothetical protein SCHPADRAFT_486558 [Schizopora paradoxa]
MFDPDSTSSQYGCRMDVCAPTPLSTRMVVVGTPAALSFTMASLSEGWDDEKRFSMATSEGDVTLVPDSPLLASKEYPSSIFSSKSESPPSSIAYTSQSHWPLIYSESDSRTPGRNILRLYSVVRRRIERAIARLSAVEGGKEVNGTVKEVDGFLSSLAEQGNEIEFHDALLACAGSKRQDLQIASFRRIIAYVTRSPSRTLELRLRCEALKKSVDRMIRSWKKTGVVYDVEWLHYYDIASLCLSDGPVMHAISQRPEYPNWINFISILDRCTNVAETMLALEFIADQVYSFQYVDIGGITKAILSKNR